MLEILEPARDLTLSVAQLNAERDALLARAYMGVGRNDEAVPLLRSALEAELARDPDYYASASHASSVSSLAVASGSLADRQAAITVLEDAIVRDQEVTGCFWCPFLYNEKGVHHSALGDFAAAAAALEQSVAVQMQVDPTRRAATDRALMNAAHLRFFALGDVDGARSALETVQAIADDTKGPSAVLAEARALQAEMALADGRTDLALERMQEAETLFAEFGGAPDSHKFAFGPLRIQLLVQAGRLDEARQELQRIEALPDSDAVRRQRLRGALYLALASGEDSQAEILRDTYAAEVAQLGPGDYLGPYRLAGIDRLLGGT
jgi:tetratricopeptide (TPR) repeat protein